MLLQANVNVSDYTLLIFPNFTYGRQGDVAVFSNGSVAGTGSGLRSRTLTLLSGQVQGVNASSRNSSVGPLPTPNVAVAMDTSKPIVLSTSDTQNTAMVLQQTAAYRASELATLSPYGAKWGDVKDAVQVCFWSCGVSHLVMSLLTHVARGKCVDIPHVVHMLRTENGVGRSIISVSDRRICTIAKYSGRRFNCTPV